MLTANTRTNGTSLVIDRQRIFPLSHRSNKTTKREVSLQANADQTNTTKNPSLVERSPRTGHQLTILPRYHNIRLDSLPSDKKITYVNRNGFSAEKTSHLPQINQMVETSNFGKPYGNLCQSNIPSRTELPSPLKDNLKTNQNKATSVRIVLKKLNSQKNSELTQPQLIRIKQKVTEISDINKLKDGFLDNASLEFDKNKQPKRIFFSKSKVDINFGTIRAKSLFKPEVSPKTEKISQRKTPRLIQVKTLSNRDLTQGSIDFIIDKDHTASNHLMFGDIACQNTLYPSNCSEKIDQNSAKCPLVNRCCNFIIRKERRLNSTLPVKLKKLIRKRQEDQLDDLNKQEFKLACPPAKDEIQSGNPPLQLLFTFNNTKVVSHSAFVEDFRVGSLFCLNQECTSEAKDAYSTKSSLSDTSKKENEKFGNLIRWKIGGFIGSGSHGQVFKAMEIDTGSIIAVKKIPFTNSFASDMIESIDCELSILQKLKHQNIVQYLGHENIDNTLYIYMEYVAGGNLPSIYRRYGPLHEKTIKVYAKQILHGLQFLHDNGVIHKDIKGANILVHKDGTVKLSDFGCSSDIERTIHIVQNPVQSGLKGSVPWMAPEVVKETGFGRRSDIWSFGCTILEMATGKIPWSQYSFDNHITLMMKIALTEETPQIPEFLSNELKDFIGLCLKRNQEDRPHAAELLCHKFLAD